MRRIAEQGSRGRSSSALFSPPTPVFLLSRPSPLSNDLTLNLDSQDLHTAWSHLISHSRSITICPLLKSRQKLDLLTNSSSERVRLVNSPLNNRSWFHDRRLHSTGLGYCWDIEISIWPACSDLHQARPILLFNWVSFWSQLRFMWMRTSLWFRSRLYVLGLEWTFDLLSRRAYMISENTNAVLPKDPNTLCPSWHYHLTAHYQ